jgi:hypothetical protein
LVRFLDPQRDSEIPVVERQQVIAVSDNLATCGTQEVQD